MSTKAWPDTKFTVSDTNGNTFQITVGGRARWALESLMKAGPHGCTPISDPAPRWSHYVWLLRGEGVEIETVTEQHGGAFPGSHGRYVLRSQVAHSVREVA